MVLMRRRGSWGAILPVVAVLVTVLGLMSAYQALFRDAPYPIPITDFGRDLLGARAAQLGINPYQTVGDLAAAIPDSGIPTEASDLWVAHSPLSIAVARLWLTVAGPDLAEDIAEFVQGLSLVLLLGGVWLFGARTWSHWHGLLLASATALTLGFRLDAFYIQGASLVALGLFLVLLMERQSWRTGGLLLLGGLVAWRPWLAPMALVLPRSASGTRDGVQVALTATLATLLVLPWIGGWQSVTSWVFEALPANLEFYSAYEWNMSPSGPFLSAAAGSVLYLAATLLLPSQRGRWISESWPVLGAAVILALTPLVWSHYWLALTIVLLYLARVRSFPLVVVTVLVMAWPLASSSPQMTRVSSYLAVALLIVTLFAKSTPGVDDQAPPIQEGPIETEG
jgi:hypothetical protein